MNGQFVVLSVALVATSLFAVLLVRLTKRFRVQPAPPEFIAQCSVDRYRPKDRFLASQPGFDPSIARKLRARRRKAFRAYLAAMSRDFERLYVTAKQIAVYSEHDRADFIVLLARQKVLFEFALMMAYGRLALHAAGLGTVNVSGLLEALDQISAHASHLAPAPSA